MTHNIPYNDVDLPFKSIIGNIMTGKLRPDCQEGLDRELVECIEKCWAQEPNQRPTLEDLEIKIIPLCDQNFY